MAATDRFVGREPEQEKIGILLMGSARLITLTGQGGIGKTRLLTETLRRFRRAKDIPVYWTRLARLPSGAAPAVVEAEVARSVVGTDFSGRAAADLLISALTRTDGTGRDLQTVLVMDNCEHLLAGAGHVIAKLLESVPGLTIAATSREAVGWADEHLVHVPPLTWPEALSLFRQRAELTGRPVADGEQSALARRICRHVHANPLYIRLAAARLRHQPLAGVLSELSGEPTDKRMHWSHGPRVGADPRHRGVRDVIAWSYDLCSDKEKLLLERMSVFAAGYDSNPEEDTTSVLDVGAELGAIEAVCADEPSTGPDGGCTSVADRVLLAAHEIESLLERLADRSLVTVHILPTSVRYSLLESIRVFAKHRLAARSTNERDEWAALTSRHRRYYRDSVAYARREWFGPGEQDPQVWTRAAWDNILTAIESAFAAGEPEIGLEIVVSSIGLTDLRGPTQSVRKWIEYALRATPDSAELRSLRVAATSSIAWVAVLQGKADDAERVLADCVAACVEDPALRRSWRRMPETDIGLPGPVEFCIGVTLLLAHRDPRSVHVLGRARAKLIASRDLSGAVWSDMYQALAASLLGSAEQALRLSREHLELATAGPCVWATAWAELTRAIALTRYGDPSEALALGRTALAHQIAARDRWGAALAVYVRMGTLARIITDAATDADRAASVESATEIAHLAGGAAREMAQMGIDIGALGPIADVSSRVVDIARDTLGPERYAAAERRGRGLRPERSEVQRLALGTLSEDRLPRRESAAEKGIRPLWNHLSVAERQVAVLAAAGWTNSAIAVRRGSSSKTVDAQMASTLQKLMITSRADIIDLVPEDRIEEVEAEAAKRPRRVGDRSRKARPS